MLSNKVAVSAVMACVGKKRMMLPTAQEIATIIGLTLTIGLELIKVEFLHNIWYSVLHSCGKLSMNF